MDVKIVKMITDPVIQMISLNMSDNDKIHPQSHNSTQYIYSGKK